MNTEEGGPTGLLVLRLWTEPGHQLRARVTSTTDLHRLNTTAYASTRADVLLLVAAWLDELTPAEPR